MRAMGNPSTVRTPLCSEDVLLVAIRESTQEFASPDL
jgi:hypothetical protein